MAKPPRTPKPPKPPRTPSPFTRAFGAFVKRLRKARGMTQEVLAERAGLAADTIRRLEYGEFSPSLDTLAKLTDGLGIDLATLFNAFALGEPGTDRELLAMAGQLAPAEIRVAIRLFAQLAELLSAMSQPRAGSDDDDE